mmetsp:Transcript_39531/g.63404  ORF Transcript_39531/g.63404 Transcript_39531/m.63404 type:complete len:316 (+) Transcript_39531:3-950(+)
MMRGYSLLLHLLLLASQAAAQLQCQSFAQIYDNGTELCENMWGDAFKVVDNISEAYTMWFFDDQNPNAPISQRLHPTGNTSTCNLQYLHKTLPTAEGDDFTECHPWKEASCCSSNTANVTNLLNGYGPGYRWDRCGALSQACERFFVQEACFYECSPHIGLYRRYGGHACDPASGQCTNVHNASNPGHNTWEVFKMPIRRDYCDAWWTACRNDMFCSNSGGNYFACALIPTTPNVTTPPPEVITNETTEEKEVLAPGLIALVVILGILLVAVAGFLCIVYRREKSGNPIFTPLKDRESKMPSQPSIAMVNGKVDV